jgi:plasmid stabilization system protein ParE
MRFTVFWKPSAEASLASIWTAADDRGAVRSAADSIDVLLRTNPESRGESRSGSTRILVVPPLAVTFEVHELDLAVFVLGVRHLPRPRGAP